VSSVWVGPCAGRFLVWVGGLSLPLSGVGPLRVLPSCVPVVPVASSHGMPLARAHAWAVNQRSPQSHTRARRSRSQHCHRMQKTLRHEVTQGWGAERFNSSSESRGLGCSKGVALTRYRALTWYLLRVSSLRTHLEPWTAVDTRGGGLPCCPVTSSGTSGAANGRAGEEY